MVPGQTSDGTNIGMEDKRMRRQTSDEHILKGTCNTFLKNEVFTIIKNEVFQLLGQLIRQSVRPNVRSRQLGIFVNLGRLELTFQDQSFRDYSFLVRYLVKNKATL